MLAVAKKKGYQGNKKDAWEEIYNWLYVSEIEPHLGLESPTFIYDFPAQFAPLAKTKKGDPRLKERFELYLFGMSGVAPVMSAHFQCDFCRGRTVRAVETMSQSLRGEFTQAFGKLHHGFMGESGQHHMFQRIELIDNRRVDAWIAMAEQVDPPRADRIEIAFAVEVV